MASLLIITLLGVALARLHRASSVPDQPEAVIVEDLVPEDLWADFDAVTGTGSVSIVARTTVGALHGGAAGWVGIDAVRLDASGDLWLDAAAVVHLERTSERILVRRDATGYQLQRHPVVVPTPTGGAAPATRACVRVDSLFD